MQKYRLAFMLKNNLIFRHSKSKKPICDTNKVTILNKYKINIYATYATSRSKKIQHQPP